MGRIQSKRNSSTRLFRMAAILLLAGLATQGCSGSGPEPANEETVVALPPITEASFGCISDLTAVDRFLSVISMVISTPPWP
jgi:hypothetical protein